MSDLLKKADVPEYKDDAWREILHANGFEPSGVNEEVWRSPKSDLKVKIDVDREAGEPYYQIVTEDGAQSAHWTDSEALKSIIESGSPTDTDDTPSTLTPDEEKQFDADFMKDMKIVGRQRTSKKFAGRPPLFSFAVPMDAAGTVAFHLAKAGMTDFDVEHISDDDISVFTFPSEPEMHVAEEIVKAEYAPQIKSHKGLWGMWAEAGHGQDAFDARVVGADGNVLPPTEKTWALIIGQRDAKQEAGRFYFDTQEEGLRHLKSMAKRPIRADQEEDLRTNGAVYIGNYLVSLRNSDYPQRRLDVYASVEQKSAQAARNLGKFAGQWGDRSHDSDSVHDILDKHREIPTTGNTAGFDTPVPDENVPALLKEMDASGADEDVYIGVIVFLVTHGSNVPKLYRDRARQMAFALVSNEEYLGEWQNPGLRRVELENEIELLEGSGKTAEMTPSEVSRMDKYRDKKLQAWIEELGLDLTDEIKRYNEGDFHERDKVYEEVREMIREDRQFQSAYRRKKLYGR